MLSLRQYRGGSGTFIVDPELYKTLNVRFSQDKDPATHTIGKFIKEMYSPLIFDGRVVKG
ncbi:hypothetical protein PKHYL_14160 [Psychrobacter sp. KH172YL61]|nr:hypothetical protein PKHYL_14160 [Psychrobacter sp. KH172YL61]